MIEKKIYRYKAFGLNLNSDIEIPELDIGNGEKDVRIQLGIVPNDINDMVEHSDQYQLSRTEFTFDIEDVARYHIIDGNQIVVEPYAETDMDRVTVYLLGTAMGVLFIQRNRIAIHGSTVSVGQRAIIITGDCGAGKTSLSSEFRKNGYGFLADDISAISMNQELQLFVHPAFPQQRLCTDTALNMGYDLSTLKLASMEENKYIVKLEEQYIGEKMPLAAIVEICISDTEEVTLEELRGIDKIKHIEKNIYCGPLYDNMGFTNDYYQALLLIAKITAYYKVSRPISGFTVEEQLKKIIYKLTGDDIG
jgi:GTPase SAR1 family protein